MKLATLKLYNFTERQRKELEKERGTQIMFIESDYEEIDGKLERVVYILVQSHRYMFIDLDCIGIEYELVHKHNIKTVK